MAEPEIDPERLRFEFVAGDDKPRLDEFIATRLPKVSLTRIRRLIAEGDAQVNDAASLKGARLQPGDRVSVRVFAAEKSSATPEAIPLDVLYEDDDIVVVNKQVGLLTHPSHREKSGTLMNALAWHFWQSSGGAIRPGLVHRLDRNTSGVIVVAKTPRAHRTLSKHFRERWVKKFYLALVCGRVEAAEGEIDAPIGHDPAVFPHWRVMREGGEAREAQTRLREPYAARTRAAHRSHPPAPHSLPAYRPRDRRRPVLQKPRGRAGARASPEGAHAARLAPRTAPSGHGQTHELRGPDAVRHAIAARRA